MQERKELTEEELEEIVGSDFNDDEFEEDELDDKNNQETNEKFEEQDLDEFLAGINEQREKESLDKPLKNEVEEEGEEGSDLETLLTNINEKRDNHAPGKKLYEIKSDVGIEEHKAFFLHSSFFIRKWLLPMYICLPLVGTVATSYMLSDGLNIVTTLFAAIIMYAVLFLLVYFRAKKKLKTMRIETPDLVALTPTTFSFCENRILIIKKGKILKIPYEMLVNVCTTKQRLFLYFDNGKGIVIKLEDLRACVNEEEFMSYIKSRIKGKK